MVCLEYHLPKFNAETVGHAESMMQELLGELRSRNAQIPTRRPHIAMPERRSGEARYWLAVGGIVKPLDSGSQEPVAVEMRDLSAGGCRLTSDKRFSPGALLSLQLKRPGYRMDEAEILLEVRRSKRLRLPESFNYEIGCKRINEKTLKEITARRRMLLSAYESLRETERFHVIHLASGPGSQNARKVINQAGFAVQSLKGAGQVLSALDEVRETALASLILAPAPLVMRSPRPAWVKRLQRDYPGTALVVIASDYQERGRLETLEDLDFAIAAEDVPEKMDQALRAAFFANCLSVEDVMPPQDLKTLVVGRREMSLRRLQTFL
ncbi:MAG: PilZ domain-containing protein, partial [Candidatus Sumerlaeota bacterium]